MYNIVTEIEEPFIINELPIVFERHVHCYTPAIACLNITDISRNYPGSSASVIHNRFAGKGSSHLLW